MEQKTLVIFDVDDTLLNSMSHDSRSFSQTFLDLYGQPLATIDWSTYPHVTDTTIFNTAFELLHRRLPEPEEVEIFRNRFVELIMANRANDPDGFHEISGALDMVNFLLDHDDYLVGIATGGWMAPAKAKLAFKGFDIAPIFDSYADHKETREEILMESVNKARQSHEDIRPVYLGDAIWDVQTTRNLSMDFIGVRHRSDYQVLENQGATQIISDYHNVQGFLQMLDQATPPLLPDKMQNF